jgi:hypothetical protein
MSNNTLLHTELECSLCMRLFYEPIAINCGHTFCKVCLRRSLALTPNCPLCRASCFIDTSSSTRNLALESIIRTLFPGEYTLRREEHIRDEEEINSQRLSFFFLSNTLHRLLPGMPVELYVFEPRYLQLMQRCMEDSCMFGISPSIDERLGAAVRLDKVRRLPNGNMYISGIVRFRFQTISALEIEPGSLGLYSAQVRYIEDEEEVTDQNIIFDLTRLLSKVPEAIHLSIRSQKALLVNAGINGTQTETKACSLLRDELTTFFTQILASLSPTILERFHNRYGQLPTGGNISRFSLYICAILYMSREERLTCFQTTCTLRRLVICYIALERHLRELTIHRPISDTQTQTQTRIEEDVMTSTSSQVLGSTTDTTTDSNSTINSNNDNYDQNELGLRPLLDLPSQIVLDMLNDSSNNKNYGIFSRFFSFMEQSPAFSSLLVLAASIFLILLLRNN